MGRLVLRTALIIAIIALCVYSHYEYSKRHSSIGEIKDDPDRYENVSFRSEGRARDVVLISTSPSNVTSEFTLVVMGEDIRAVYPKSGSVEEGDYVIVYGVLHMKSGYLKVEQLHVYRDIRRLYALSVVGLVFVAYLFLGEWKFHLRGSEWRRRNA